MNIFTKKRNRDLFEAASRRLSKSHKGGLDAIFLTHREDAGSDRCFFLVTGIEEGSFLYSSAVMYPDGSVHLFVHQLEEEEAKQTGLPYSVIQPGKETIISHLKGLTGIGINAQSITLSEAGRLKEKRFSIKNIAPELEDARAIKTEQEIVRMREAGSITARTAAKIPQMLKLGMTEKELAARIDYEMALLGSSGAAFATIAAFGENSAIPHAHPGNRQLKKGDFVLCDFGATSGKYCSDITRVFVAGQASNSQKSLYNTILSIQLEALKKVKLGINAKELHTAADDAVLRYFEKIKAPGRMGHGLGHSIGLYTHDGKRIGTVDYEIPDNFITTIEPAGYLPGFGGVRIEDTILIRKNEIEILTHEAPKNSLIEVPF
ncbi:MAG: aminopeptidase P family protein [Fibrobacteres bacterium]|nr:aminopeptidase P family protein [Fibrobacterota bacterium]